MILYVVHYIYKHKIPNLAREVSIAVFRFGVLLYKAKAKLHKEAEDKIEEVPVGMQLVLKTQVITGT